MNEQLHDRVRLFLTTTGTAVLKNLVIQTTSYSFTSLAPIQKSYASTQHIASSKADLETTDWVKHSW